jgi:hypothetical protein
MKSNLLYFSVLVSLMVFTVAFSAGPDLSSLSTPVPPPKRASLLTTQEIKHLDSVEVDYLFRGKCYAQSSLLNSRPSNGEAHFGILPQKVDSTFSNGELYLVINSTEYVEIGESKLGCKLYLVNTSDTLMNFRASDSRLHIIAEVLDENNLWVPISYLPSSGCGNSIHTITLGINEFWQFNIPVFKGEFKTKLRYQLTRGKQIYYSNEVFTFINKKQFDPERKEGHSKKNLMDPYDD